MISTSRDTQQVTAYTACVASPNTNFIVIRTLTKVTGRFKDASAASAPPACQFQV